MVDASTFAQGFILGLGMFACPGPKDILILRQAITGRSAAGLVAIGALSDALLLVLGMAGASVALSTAPWLQKVALGLGVCLMAVHALLSARRAVKGGMDIAALTHTNGLALSRGSLAALLAVSFLNPVAWLDTILVIGTVGAALPPTAQVPFASGAIVASFTWFSALVMGGRWAGRWMVNPTTWRILEGCVAVAMGGLAVQVARAL